MPDVFFQSEIDGDKALVAVSSPDGPLSTDSVDVALLDLTTRATLALAVQYPAPRDDEMPSLCSATATACGEIGKWEKKNERSSQGGSIVGTL